MNQMSGRPSFTSKQGQYLAFIDAYTRVHRRAEHEMQRHFGVTPPSVHQMILTLERAGLIRRQPGIPRSIEVLVPPEVCVPKTSSGLIWWQNRLPSASMIALFYLLLALSASACKSKSQLAAKTRRSDVSLPCCGEVASGSRTAIVGS